MGYGDGERWLRRLDTRITLLERKLLKIRSKELSLPAMVERLRPSTDSISATTASEFAITSSSGRPSLTVEKALLCAITYKSWAAVTGGNGLRIGIALTGATVLEWNLPTWGDVIRATASGNVIVTKYVVLQPGTTEFSVMGYREATTNAPTTAYQILQIVPMSYQ